MIQSLHGQYSYLDIVEMISVRYFLIFYFGTPELTSFNGCKNA